MTDLKSLPAPELINATEKAVRNERASTIEVVRHFQEIADRKLYLARGFSSLFDMVTKHFGYCAASAQRRINSMRLVRDIPEVEQQIESGKLTLTAAATVQTFFYAEAKEKVPYTKNEKIELIESCLNKSTREIERELARRNPTRDLHETVRHLSEDRLRLSLSISEELNQKLERLKNIMSHSNPNMRIEELIDRLADMALEKLDPLKRQKKSLNHSQLPAPKVRKRYIAAHIKDQVWRNNKGTGCEFVDPETKRKCSAKHLLQIDHIEPFSCGGNGSVENLRVLCAAHNQFMWKTRLPKDIDNITLSWDLIGRQTN